MPQQIQPLGTNPYAEEALRLAEQGRGQEGMGRTAAPVGPNLQDQGGMSKPNVNTQPYNNSAADGTKYGTKYVLRCTSTAS